MRPIFLLSTLISSLFFITLSSAIADANAKVADRPKGEAATQSEQVKQNPSQLTKSSSSAKATEPLKIIVLGDSLTEGYGVTKDAAFPFLLEKKMNSLGDKSWKIINAGVSGSTTASAISRMKWQLKSKPDYMFIALGANDGLRGLAVKTSEKNLSDAIEFAQKNNLKVILGGLYMPPNYGKKYTDDFSRMYSDLAKKYKVIFIPFILDKVAGDPKYNLPDGIHPNEAGHAVIAETLFNALKEKL